MAKQIVRYFVIKATISLPESLNEDEQTDEIAANCDYKLEYDEPVESSGRLLRGPGAIANGRVTVIDTEIVGVQDHMPIGL